MRRLDGYLSRHAQVIYPGALVYCDERGGNLQIWTLERPGAEPLDLGESFHAATQAVQALKAAARANHARG